MYAFPQRAPKGPHNKDPSKSGFRVFFFKISSLLPARQRFGRQPSLPKACVSSIRMSSSPKVLDLDGCFSLEKGPYHDHGDSLVWTGPQ